MRISSLLPIVTVLLSLGLAPAHAASIETAGTDVAVLLPFVAGGITAYKGDWTGTAELGGDTVATVGSAYVLKSIIKEQRPDKSDFKSFPSDTAALAFAPAQFLWDRYGWQYGLPAYAAAIFVGYSRVDAKKHHWWDVAASAGMSFGFSKFITTRYHRGFNYSASASPDGAFASVDYRF